MRVFFDARPTCSGSSWECGSPVEESAYDASGYRVVHIDARGRPVISLRQGDGQVLAEYTVHNADNSAQLARHLLYGAGQLLVERPVVIIPPQSQPREPIWEPGKAWFDAGVADPQASLMSDISAPSGFHNSVGGLTADAQGDVFVPESALSPGETNTLQFRTTAPEESAYSLPINIVVDPNVGSGTPNQMRALSIAYSGASSGSDLVLRWRLFAENGQKTKVYFKPQGSPARVLLTQMALNAGVRVLVMNSQTYSLGCGEFTLDAVITGQPTRTSVPLLTPACTTTYSGSTTYGSGTILLADRFQHRDHLGSLRVAFDERGWVTARHDFYPFGREMRPGAVESARLFTGHERDAGSGLDYMLARYRSLGEGRFLSVDPGSDVQVRDPQSWNQSIYVRNRAVCATDPDGKLAAFWHFLVSYFAARKEGHTFRNSVKLAWVSVKVDFKKGSQSNDAKSTVLHAMRGLQPDGKPQTASHSRRAVEQSVHDNVAIGTAESLGTALHTVQDRATPAHRDHVWSGFRLDLSTLRHLAGDVLPAPSTLREAYAASREVLQQARDQGEQAVAPTSDGATP